MAPSVAIENVEDDENYASEEDSDFAPDRAPKGEDLASEASESEDEVETNTTKKSKKSKKRKRGDDEAEDVGYDNSGDEAIIGKGLKKSRKAKKGDIEKEDEGGEGGFVRTRAMMAAAGPEEHRKPLSTEGATVDVDALWASLMSAPLRPITGKMNSQQEESDTAEVTAVPAALQPIEEESDMITIKRTYNFAGKVHSETKAVPRHSAEAKLYLASQASKDASADVSPNLSADSAATTKLRRPRARRSIFEPITEALPQRTDLRFKVGSYAPIAKNGPVAKKLNTVEKSKMDWAGFVDKEGIKDDLETAAKAKGTYLDNQEFLLRAEDRREEESRKARLKGLA